MSVLRWLASGEAALLAWAVAAGYLLGRVRPGQRLLAWAEDRDLGPHGPAWWAAQAVGLAAVAWMLTVHPRRSMANRRSWQEARNVQRSPAVRMPAPRLDPNWAANRRATDPNPTTDDGEDRPA
ncbi:hypothetical protein [Actinacidiphila acididurans]|uniref:Uncharacterized protein n=1 Tax=Actinacidiphila acididurans TaxID=2784346 RepID=A0ABS2U4L0_9ACTN|nr:hypothetical protein [Actinacidiphila acididurans]MBM9509932.1 hypothetical protein [Actinacidiphila acididurans]